MLKASLEYYTRWIKLSFVHLAYPFLLRKTNMHLPCAPKPYLLDPLLPSFCLADRAHQAPWEHRSGTTQAPMQPQSMRIHPCAHTQHSTLPPRPDTFRKTQAEKIKNLTNQGRREGIVPRVVRSQASQALLLWGWIPQESTLRFMLRAGGTWLRQPVPVTQETYN